MLRLQGYTSTQLVFLAVESQGYRAIVTIGAIFCILAQAIHFCLQITIRQRITQHPREVIQIVCLAVVLIQAILELIAELQESIFGYWLTIGYLGRISGILESELISKARRVLALQRQGKKLVFPDILKIETAIIKSLP